MSCNLSDMLPISGVALDLQTAQVQYTCPHCPSVTHSIPNWRRHCTVQHQLPRHRTAAIAILGMSLHGRPQCNHCTKFSQLGDVLQSMSSATVARCASKRWRLWSRFHSLSAMCCKSWKIVMLQCLLMSMPGHVGMIPNDDAQHLIDCCLVFL